MFLKKQTKPYTENFSVQIDRLQTAFHNADTVVIGAGSGLSTAAGFTYSGERFQKYFSDFAEKYGFRDMYSGGFYPFSSLEEYWAYWSRYIYVNRYCDPPKPIYQQLLQLVEQKDYFVITTNVDHCFQKAGFNKQRLFYTQGDYGLLQCSEPCRQEIFDNETRIREMVQRQQNMKVPTELLPICPYCGKPLTMNLRADNKFVEDNGWKQAAERYATFLRQHEDGNVLYLELGVGYNTPGIIKYPFWRRTLENPNAVYACINFGETVSPEEIAEQSICIDANIGNVLEKLHNKNLYNQKA